MLVAMIQSSNDSNAISTTTKRRGATLMEYLMMISLIITVCLVGVGFFGNQTKNVADATSKAISKSVKGS